MGALIRFVVPGNTIWTGAAVGLIQYAYRLRDDVPLSVNDRSSLLSALAWLDEHLPVPTRFNRSRSKGYYRRATAAISWFRDTATYHIGLLRVISGVAKRYSVDVIELTTCRPGYIVYEDDVQVVAEPFADTPRMHPS